MFASILGLLTAPIPPPDRCDHVLGTARRTDEQLVASMDAAHERISAAERELFELIAAVDRREAWRDDGAHDMAHWLCMRYGLSSWKAYRWIAAAHALEDLPRPSRAFAQGELGIHKVVGPARFALRETEAGQNAGAPRVYGGARPP